VLCIGGRNHTGDTELKSRLPDLMLQPPHLFFATSQVRNPEPPTLIPPNCYPPHPQQTSEKNGCLAHRGCQLAPNSLPTRPAIRISPARADTLLHPIFLPSPHPNPEPAVPHDVHYDLTEGLGSAEPRQYRDSRSLIRAVESQAGKLYSGKNASQYAVFAPVTQDQLAAIERIRETRFRGHRFHYLNREETLIIKIFAGPFQGLASKGFGALLDIKIARMGLFEDIGRMESTTYKGKGSQKEANCAWKPWKSRPLGTDWPTLIIECGVSKSSDRLAVDAHWWLENSGGQVKIVLLISFSKSRREISLQQWELVTIPDPHVTPGQPRPTRTAPAIMREFDLVVGVSNEASLTLNFEKVFLRPPAEGEGDFTFSQ